jgi:hypothetical protein
MKRRIGLSSWKNAGPDSVVDIATGYGLDGAGIKSRCVATFSAPVQTGPGAHPASCAMGTGFSPVVKSGRGVTLTPYPILVPWLRMVRAIPLFSLWAIRPVQSLSACTSVHFTFYRGNTVALDEIHTLLTEEFVVLATVAQCH